MSKEKVQDYTGKIIGWIEWSGNKKWLSDFYGKRLGYYDSSLNKTFDFYGRQVAQGDCVMMLLR